MVNTIANVKSQATNPLKASAKEAKRSMNAYQEASTGQMPSRLELERRGNLVAVKILQRGLEDKKAYVYSNTLTKTAMDGSLDTADVVKGKVAKDLIGTLNRLSSDSAPQKETLVAFVRENAESLLSSVYSAAVQYAANLGVPCPIKDLSTLKLGESYLCQSNSEGVEVDTGPNSSINIGIDFSQLKDVIDSLLEAKYLVYDGSEANVVAKNSKEILDKFNKGSANFDRYIASYRQARESLVAKIEALEKGVLVDTKALEKLVPELEESSMQEYLMKFQKEMMMMNMINSMISTDMSLQASLNNKFSN